MEKFSNVKAFDLNNKYDKFIYGLFESRINGDWNDYEEGEEIEYVWDLRNEDWFDVDFSFEKLCEFVGDGFSSIDNEGELVYNVKINNYDLIVTFI
jgi:hypothetical protein